MAWAAFILLVALALRDRAPFAGATFCGAVGAYGIGRFFFQKLRDDQSGGVETNILQKVSVILALLAVIGGLLVWLR
jgi:prolipoprotein diacylglyceryltransferase